MRFNIQDLIYVSFPKHSKRYIKLENGIPQRIDFHIPQFKVYELAVINKDKTKFIPISKFKEKEIHPLSDGCKRKFFGIYKIEKAIVAPKSKTFDPEYRFALYFPCNSFSKLEKYDIKKQQLYDGYTLEQIQKINDDIKEIQINTYCDKIMNERKQTYIHSDAEEQYQNF